MNSEEIEKEVAPRVFTQVFVVVAGILEKDGKILLVQENSVHAEKGKWNHPGGWLDVEEQPLDGVKREVKEETGFDFEPDGLIGIYSLVRRDRKWKHGVSPHAIKLVFRGKFSGEPIRPNDEIAQFKWWAPEEIYQMEAKTLRDMHIKQIVRDYFEGKSYPLEIIHHTISE